MPSDLEFSPQTTHIKLDTYPAKLHRVDRGQQAGDIVADECRIIVTNDYLYAINTDGVGQPYFILREELVAFTSLGKDGWSVEGANQDYFVTRNGSCGCGSRLRGMLFLPGKPHISSIATTKR